MSCECLLTPRYPCWLPSAHQGVNLLGGLLGVNLLGDVNTCYRSVSRELWLGGISIGLGHLGVQDFFLGPLSPWECEVWNPVMVVYANSRLSRRVSFLSPRSGGEDFLHRSRTPRAEGGWAPQGPILPTMSIPG